MGYKTLEQGIFINVALNLERAAFLMVTLITFFFASLLNSFYLEVCIILSTVAFWYVYAGRVASRYRIGFPYFFLIGQMTTISFIGISVSNLVFNSNSPGDEVLFLLISTVLFALLIGVEYAIKRSVPVY